MLFSRNMKPFLTEEETQRVLEAIRVNEANTSGEIRLCIESKCKYMEPLRRAHELFWQLKMNLTEDRNAVLIYIAHKDKDFALYCDGALFQKTPMDFWKEETRRLRYHFFHHHYMEGLIDCIEQVGGVMAQHFPFEGEKKNELPDEIIFGR